MKKRFKGLVSGLMAGCLLATSFILPVSAARIENEEVGAYCTEESVGLIYDGDSREKLSTGDMRVGAVFYKKKDYYQWGGTAWVFSKRAFATAGHVARHFYDSDVEEMVVVLGLHSKYTNPSSSSCKTIKINHAELNYAPWEVMPGSGCDWGILETEEDIFDVEKPNINCFPVANKSLTKNAARANTHFAYC